MPKPKSGNDPWKAVAVKIPPDLLEEVGPYADLNHTSVSALIREGLELRLHGQQLAESASSITVIPPATLAVFNHLATTLDMAAAELRRICGLHIEQEYNGHTITTPTLEEPVADVRTCGNTVIPLVQGDETARIADDGQADALEPVTETITVTEPRSQARAYGEVPSVVLAALAQQQSATAAELAKALGDNTKAGTKAVWQALQRLLKRGAVIREGQQYRLPA
jgi:hypothetical protein